MTTSPLTAICIFLTVTHPYIPGVAPDRAAASGKPCRSGVVRNPAPPRPDGAREPDYCRVFFQPAADGGLAYSFDRAGLRFCRRLPPPAPREGWLECQGRAFRIAGAVS